MKRFDHCRKMEEMILRANAQQAAADMRLAAVMQREEEREP